MITHRIIQPEFNGNLAFVGFTNIILHDINHMMTPEIEHDEIYNLWTEIHPRMRTANGAPMRELQENENIGTRIPENGLDEIQRIMEELNLFQNAPRAIGHLLAVTADYNMIPHGNFAILDARIYILATGE